MRTVVFCPVLTPLEEGQRDYWRKEKQIKVKQPVIVRLWIALGIWTIAPWGSSGQQQVHTQQSLGNPTPTSNSKYWVPSTEEMDTIFSPYLVKPGDWTCKLPLSGQTLHHSTTISWKHCQGLIERNLYRLSGFVLWKTSYVFSASTCWSNVSPYDDCGSFFRISNSIFIW